MREALIFAFLASALGGQPAVHSYIGAGGCASSNCHGGTTTLPEKDSRILGTEYTTWIVSDKHALAYKSLVDPRGKRMAEILKLDATRDRRCTACHVVGSPEKSRTDGVSCEACHGAATEWLGTHTRENSHAASVKAGMIDTKGLAVRAKTCLACHLGTGEQQVDHEMIAAGHPDLAFELDTFSAGQPAHYREGKPGVRARSWAIGQTVGLAENMRLVASHEKTWPEYSDMECYQCHHDLRLESWRVQRGYAGRRPGSSQISHARVEIVRELVAVAAPDQRATFEAAVARLNGPAMANAVARIADALTVRFQSQEFDRQALVRALVTNIGRIADAGVGAAEQATMALDALATRPGISTLYDYLEHPSTYLPSEFAVMFRRVAGE
jgi:hypothetical protein